MRPPYVPYKWPLQRPTVLGLWPLARPLAGVEAAQVALAARQKSLLMQARWQRGEAKHRMERALRPLNPQQFNSGQRLSAPGLAVVPKPTTSITPDYVPVPNFSRRQSQSFSFSLDLGSRFLPLSWIQSAHCEVTLKGKEKAWQLRVSRGQCLRSMRYAILIFVTLLAGLSGGNFIHLLIQPSSSDVQ